MASSESYDRALVGRFFGLLAGVVALVLVLLWSLFRGSTAPSPPRSPWSLHLGYVLLYAVAGAIIGILWPIRRRTAGRWVLWFLSTATGAVTVNSVASGPPWDWTLAQWRSYALIAVLFTPVFAWDRPRKRGRA